MEMSGWSWMLLLLLLGGQRLEVSGNRSIGQPVSASKDFIKDNSLVS
jgi:hypothetical protein